MTAYEPIALTGGRWVIDTKRRVQVWRPYAPGLKDPESGEPIACPCGTTVTRTCRTKGGHRAKDHAERWLPRACVCGQPLAWKRRKCRDCLAWPQKETAA
jgi:hypothetical protein